jgi:two-component system phosphate regulon sensor histidine kinase PhoR
VVGADGQILADCLSDPARMGNYSDRPEIQGALKGEITQMRRYNPDMQAYMLYVAVPVRMDDDIPAVVRTALPMSPIKTLLQRIYSRIFLMAVLILVLAVVLSIAVSHRIGHPLQNMRKAAEHFARGDFGLRIAPENTNEVGGLANAMNWMAAQLDEKIQTIQQQTQEREAILASMVEGVLAIDTHQRIINMNDAASVLMQINPEKSQGRNIEAAIRNVEIQRFAKQALQNDNPIEADLILHDHIDRFLQAHGTRLRNKHGDILGALIVIHDITHLRRLENLRRDFVANVSHELRTPITSIKGFVETLIEDAPEDTDTAHHFLRIISRQADRLNSIIEDLLSLSRIEKDSDRDDMHRTTVRLREIMESAVMTCRVKAEENDAQIRLTCPDDLHMAVNRDLIEQAVVNLLDNAIKYSGSEQHIDLLVETLGQHQATITVRDYGCGIAAEHLDRLFERFYRVDKDRSRKLGGTGLGLAIVKHIASAHGGRVEVESTIGKGSSFRLILPIVSIKTSPGS